MMFKTDDAHTTNGYPMDIIRLTHGLLYLLTIIIGVINARRGVSQSIVHRNRENTTASVNLITHLSINII